MNKNKISYSPTITFGNILSIITMLGTLVGLYITHDTRITRLEVESKNRDAQDARIAGIVDKCMDNQEATARVVAKMQVLWEERKGLKP